MEKLKTCYANFDFDITLLSDKYSKKLNPNSKYNKNLQYLFLWTAKENELLYSHSDILYKSYENKIKLLQGYIPGISKSSSEVHYWWGDSSSQEKWIKEKLINSKITSHKIEEELGVSILSKVAHSSSDIPNEIKEYIVKKEHGFSGQGVIKDISNIKYPVLIEKKLNRRYDYGSIVDSESCNTFRNIIDKHGQYVGTYLEDNIDRYKNYKNILNEVFVKYKEEFNISSIQIDSFTYLEGDKEFFRPLCEVNHRKSMGWVTHVLNSKFGSAQSLFVIFPRHRIKDLENMFFEYDLKEREGIIQLSQNNELLQSFFMTSYSKENFKQLVNRLSFKIFDCEALETFVSSI